MQELVQVESLAQLGVQLLLFGLGLELSFSKLRAVWGVAVLGERAGMQTFGHMSCEVLLAVTIYTK